MTKLSGPKPGSTRASPEVESHVGIYADSGQAEAAQHFLAARGHDTRLTRNPATGHWILNVLGSRIIITEEGATLPNEITTPGQVVGGTVVVTPTGQGEVAAGAQIVHKETDSQGIFSSVDALIAKYQSSPATIREIIKATISGIAIVASGISFIPFTNNIGGALGSILIHDLIEPFRRRAYDASIDLALRPIMPTDDLSARLLVSGVESGALEEEQLTDELARSGTRDPAIALGQQIARVKRFDVETKDDLALVRQYQRDITLAVIRTMQDAESDTIADLKAQRKALLAEIRKPRGSVAA